MFGAVWYVILGTLLLVMALTSGALKRLPISTSLLYLAVGFLVGKVGLASLDASENEALIERVTEVGVIVSLFTAGLKLRPRAGGRSWSVPLRSATRSSSSSRGWCCWSSPDPRCCTASR